MKRFAYLALLLGWSFSSGCGGTSSEERELQRLQVEAVKETQRLEAARHEAIRLETERVRAEEEARVRHESLAKAYSRSAGAQIMEAIGGGQDLIVSHGGWIFDANTREFEVPMNVSFNGIIVRGNNYRVSGLLTVEETGVNPRFARMEANQRYLDTETSLRSLGILAAGIIILNDMSEKR
jgi:hypothetical protein